MSGDDGMPPLDLSIWRDECTQFGADPAALREILVRDVVQAAIEEHPRSLQTEIGPSELGHPCLRWLAHKFNGTPPTGIQKPMWRAAVGTAVHDKLSVWTHRYNQRLSEKLGREVVRFLPDLKVFVGYLFPKEKRRPIKGTLDLLDLWSATVVDAKVPGPNGMKKYGPGKPESPQYDMQFDCYGLGCENAGFPVASVGAFRLPAAGELGDATWNPRPYSRQRAEQGLARAGAVAKSVEVMGPAAIPLMPTTEFHCGFCPYYLPNATDLETSCPGAETFTPSFLDRRSAAASMGATETPGRKSAIDALIA